MVAAVYPGTFDPLTRGHEDLVRRASGLFDRLVVGVADSKAKRPFFRWTSGSILHGKSWAITRMSWSRVSLVCSRILFVVMMRV
jgi:cytidyltransferase-like protein